MRLYLRACGLGGAPRSFRHRPSLAERGNPVGGMVGSSYRTFISRPPPRHYAHRMTRRRRPDHRRPFDRPSFRKETAPMITLPGLHHVYAPDDADVLRSKNPSGAIIVPIAPKSSDDDYTRRLLHRVEVEAGRRGIDLRDPLTAATVTVAATEMLLASLGILDEDDDD